jgi:uncharacterized oligopeptide transporter (OPT) family protein
VKFGIGFLIGLLTGVTIILGPVIAVVVAVILKDENDTVVNNTTVVNDVPEDLPETDLSTTPDKVHYRGAPS